MTMPTDKIQRKKIVLYKISRNIYNHSRLLKWMLTKIDKRVLESITVNNYYVDGDH